MADTTSRSPARRPTEGGSAVPEIGDTFAIGKPERTTMPAGKVLVVMIVALLVWGLLYAPQLKKSAEASQDGVRRSIALAILTPVAWVSDTFRLSLLPDAIGRAVGRDPDAAVGGDLEDLAPEDIPTAPPSSDPGGGNPGANDRPKKDTKIRVPTPRDKLRVAVVGDSLAAGLGYLAERVFKPSLVRVTRQGRISTGLSRLDYFDWMAAMREIVGSYRPDLTIVMVGENDNQALKLPGGRTEQDIGNYRWPRLYEERVERFARIATSEGGHVVWVGLPIQAERERWPLVRRQNDIFERVAERLPNVVYVDAWDRFADREGGYTAFFWEDGEVQQIRESDGLHFNGAGYTILVEEAARAATEAFRLSTKTYLQD